jgi:hypothetical protein
MRSLLISTTFCAAMLVGAPAARAAVAWVGDFETADLSQWSFVAHGEYAYPQMELVAQGQFACRIELHNDAVWPNGLKRVELQHLPENGRTAEGATTFFAWSFYLPEALPEGTDQAIGYWESNNSYQQVMAFNVQGDDIVFATRRPSNVVQWQAYDVVTPGQWHRIAMRVTWSTNGGQGSVDVWFDGEQVVEQAGAQTLADNNGHFVQLGLLRDAIEFADVPVIILDDAVEGDSIEDVRPGDLPGQAGEDGGSSEEGGVGTGGPAGDDTGGGDGGLDTSGGGGGGLDEGTTAEPEPDDGETGGGGSTGVATNFSATGGDDAGASEDDSEGCQCRSSGSGWAGLWGLVPLLVLGVRRQVLRRSTSLQLLEPATRLPRP